MAQAQPKFQWPYGGARARVLGALVSGVFLLVGALFTALEAIQRVLQQEAGALHACAARATTHAGRRARSVAPGWVQLLLGLTGIVLNGWAAWTTAGDGHGHGHTHLLGGAQSEGAGTDLNRRAVLLHLLLDFGTSCILVGTALCLPLLPAPAWPYVDAVTGLGIAGITAWLAMPVVRDAGMIALQTPPEWVRQHDVEHAIKAVQGVRGIVRLQVRRGRQHAAWRAGLIAPCCAVLEPGRRRVRGDRDGAS